MSVPALRFKDEAGQRFAEWQAFSIDDAGIRVIDGDRGNNYPNGSDFSNNGYCLFLNAKNVTKSGFSFNELSFISKEKDEKLRKGKLKRNDLIITTRGSVGNIAFYNDEICYENMRINSGMVILRIENTNVNSKYLYQYFYSPNFIKLILKIAFGSAQSQLTVQEIKKFSVALPPLQEQTKIANFLTAVDEKITQLTQKHDLLTQYKKGVMQKIFSQEIRFKDDDGQDFPEWEETTLGDICKIKTGKKDVNEGNPKGKYPFFTCAKSRTYSDNFSFDCSAILIAGNGEVGHCQKYIGKFEAYQRTYVLSDFTEDVDYIFLNLNSTFQDIVSSQKQMGAMPYLKLEMLTDFKIPVPSKKEQTKIANFLTAIDDKITNTQTQLQAVKQYKQGLLQQMFV